MAPPSLVLVLSLILWGTLTLHPAAAPQPAGDSSADGDGDDLHRCQSVDSSGCTAADQFATTDSAGNNERKWMWNPAATHPCNIRRISRSELRRLYGAEGVPNLYPYPLVIYDDRDDSSVEGRLRFENLTTLDNLPSNFPPDFHATLTGSDSLSSHRRTIPLKQYLHEVLNANYGSGETLPNQLGNETWYLFGETFSDEWSEFLQNYNELPPCHSCTPLHREQNLIALSFGIGNIGSGVQWHLHGPGFSETIHGKKHWVLYPPGQRPEYDLDYASRHWMENTYPKLEDWTVERIQNEKKRHGEFLQRWNSKGASVNKSRRKDEGNQFGESENGGPSGVKPWECTINRGEMIYFPDQWHHATINLAKYTVFVSSFTTEHEG